MLITDTVLQDLRTQVRGAFRDGYDSMQPTTFWRDVAMVVGSSTASNTYDWLGDFPELREWVGDRVVKDIKEFGYQIANRTFQGTVGIARTHIEDDNLGTVGLRARRQGQAAAQHPDRLLVELMKNGASQLCYDGQNFFDVDHPVAENHDGTGTVTSVANYDDNGGVTTPPAWYLLDTRDAIRPFIFQERTQPEIEAKENPAQSDHVFMKDEYLYGVRYRCNAGFGFWQKAWKSHAPLTGENLDAAMAAMMSFKGDGGRPLGIMPNLLVVPPALRADANKTVKVMFGEGGASNANFEAVDVRIVPWLA